ncbi:MAG: hypothetical protein HOJ16_01855 [Candidatus Peribacter sp.]|nr:hypothetical protein [Candidatus Peribacter sp.]MBT4600850.1 hypothetical protein [Candidatus Peribacter sp.]MBT5149414.1 hypothetical protein [Candidatus Peribacter sp.]MBT5637304.1 hypothetical protein [Candidatus Peribacter sp.]
MHEYRHFFTEVNRGCLIIHLTTTSMAMPDICNEVLDDLGRVLSATHLPTIIDCERLEQLSAHFMRILVQAHTTVTEREMPCALCNLDPRFDEVLDAGLVKQKCTIADSLEAAFLLCA